MVDARSSAASAQALRGLLPRTHPGIDREATAVAAGSCTLHHVFGVTGLNVAACHEGAQDAFAYVGLHLSNGGIVNLCRVKTDRLCVDRLSIWLRLKHPINYTHMKTSEAQFREPQAKGQSPSKCTCVFRVEPQQSCSAD